MPKVVRKDELFNLTIDPITGLPKPRGQGKKKRFNHRRQRAGSEERDWRHAEDEVDFQKTRLEKLFENPPPAPLPEPAQSTESSQQQPAQETAEAAQPKDLFNFRPKFKSSRLANDDISQLHQYYKHQQYLERQEYRRQRDQKLDEEFAERQAEREREMQARQAQLRKKRDKKKQRKATKKGSASGSCGSAAEEEAQSRDEASEDEAVELQDCTTNEVSEEQEQRHVQEAKEEKVEIKKKPVARLRIVEEDGF